MENLISKLAKLENRLNAVKEIEKDIQNKLEDVQEYIDLQVQRSLAKDIGGEIDTLRSEIKDQTVKAYLETGEKHIHAALGIRVGTSFEYDATEAKSWCEQRLPDALIVDKKLFEKTLKAFDKVPEFVEVKETITATIATDLSEYI